MKDNEESNLLGGLPELIRNTKDVYAGDLIAYFAIVFGTARNQMHPYHNFRHMLHVTWQCYQACIYYKDRLSRLEMRLLLIAALFHDFDHSGRMGDDDLNIELAIRALHKHLQPRDVGYLEEIIALIRATEYPHKPDVSEMGLSAQILRDADLSQAFSPAWVQQVIFGLAEEWGMTPLQTLESQTPFLENVTFTTEWAQELFPASVVEAKIGEVRALLECLREGAAITTT